MRRRVANPLALAVLAQLFERPMHPYEIAAQMRTRGVDCNIKLNYGSLYSVVEALQREQLIVPYETVRHGRLPERTIYAITEAGRAELMDWLRDLLRKPVKEYTQFAAGLTFLGLVPPEEATHLLLERLGLLETEVSERRSRLATMLHDGLPRLFVIEEEHGVVLLEAEVAWLRALINEIREGALVVRKDGRSIWKAVADYGYEVTAEGVVRLTEERADAVVRPDGGMSDA